GKGVESKAVKVGSVRLLNEIRGKQTWSEIEKWITVASKKYEKSDNICTGGNIEKLFKMAASKPGEPLSYVYLNSQYQFLQELSYEQRISELGLNPDRADVIIPAAQIYLNAFKWSGAKKLHVPKIGLSDGIIKLLYKQHNGQTVSYLER